MEKKSTKYDKKLNGSAIVRKYLDEKGINNCRITAREIEEYFGIDPEGIDSISLRYFLRHGDMSMVGHREHGVKARSYGRRQCGSGSRRIVYSIWREDYLTVNHTKTYT